MRLLSRTMLAVAVFLALAVPPAYAGGECCTRGSLAIAGAPESVWGLQLQYDYSSMKTIREGTKSVTPDAVLEDRLMHGLMKFSVPTKMVMQRYVLAAQYRPAASWQLTASLPYLLNDMDMRRAMAGGMGMPMNMSMDRVQGFGDATVGALYTLLAPASRTAGWDAAIGFGLKLPTGKNDVKRAGSTTMVHAMMQPGSGSWDPIFTLEGGHAAGKLAVRFHGVYHLATRGDEGYEYGDMLGIDVVARYQVAGGVRIGLGLNFLNTAKDADHDGKFSSPTSMIDNVDNTGLTAVYVTPEVQFAIPGTGGSISLAFQKPVSQKVNGTQQVMDWRVLAALGWTF